MITTTICGNKVNRLRSMSVELAKNLSDCEPVSQNKNRPLEEAPENHPKWRALND